jgi:hypothetical protein
MTRADFVARFPNASEACIRANVDEFPARVVPASIASAKQPANAKETKAKRKPSKRPQVPRTRNAETITEAAYWAMLRSGLRRTFIWWKPAQKALLAARIPFNGPKGQRWAFVCSDCNKRHLRRNVHIDHVEPCGALTDYSHIGDFVRRLTPESPNAYRIRCHSCHQAKTNLERGIVPPAVTQPELIS